SSDTLPDFLTLSGRHVPLLTSAFDATETTPVSTTVGLGIAPRVKLGNVRPDPSLEELIAVAAFDPRPLGQRHKVIRIDSEQDERIGRQVPVPLADCLDAHDVELSIEVAREL